MSAPSDEPVTKLPRGRGIKLSTPEVFRIVMMAAVLVAVIVLTRPCASSVATFVTSFGSGSGSAGSAAPAPVMVVPDQTQYVRLRPGMTDEQVKAAIEEAKAKARTGSAAVGEDGQKGGGEEGQKGGGVEGQKGGGAEGQRGGGDGRAGSGR